MQRNLKDHEEKLLEDLQDTKVAQEYLKTALEDKDQHLFLLALKNVYKAQGIEIAELARKTKLSRENIYRILSKRGNPKFNSLVALLKAIGFRLAVQPKNRS